jgi:type III secretion system chaperone SycN
MSWVDDAVQAFGRGMGVERMVLPETGSLEIAFERRGSFYLERAGEDLLLYLRRTYAYASPQLLRRALEACHWRQNRPFVVRIGMRDDDLVLLIRLPPREITLDRLERALAYLTEMHDQLAS